VVPLTIPSGVETIVPMLSENHQAQLIASSINPDTIDARGYHTVDKMAEIRRCGFSDRQARVPALLIPVWGVEGEVSLYQIRPDAPRIVKGKSLKYETPRGARMVVDVHPFALGRLSDPAVPLFITEGVKKGDSLVSKGCCAVALLGVWNWRGSNGNGGKTALADWESIALNGRQIYICFDSDVMLNPQVNEALTRLKGFLEKRGAKVGLIYLPAGPGGTKIGVDDYLAIGHNLDDLLGLATASIRDPRTEAQFESVGDQGGSLLPEIMITGRRLREIASDGWNAILKANKPPSVFQRGHLLVDIINNDDMRPALRTLDRPAFKGIVERVADFMKETDRGIVPARAPTDIVADMMAAKVLPLPFLLGINESPVFAPSGLLATTPGYQPETRYILALADGLSIPKVPEVPVQADIDLAQELLLNDLLADFPFVTESDKANALAALLLPLARLLIDGPTPLHLIESPTPGTGKGLLVDALTIPSAGRGASVMTEARGEEEWRKRLTAKLLSAPQFILIDNIRSRLDSAALSAALTSDIWEDRVLGYSRMAAIPVKCVWLATANNPSLSLEVARRTVPIRLDSGLEKPWEGRVFKHPKLKLWARENRGQLIWAVLTLARAWIVGGRPAGQQSLGTYEAYAEVMGGILEVAGIPGFLGNLDRAYKEADQEVLAWGELCAAWWEEFGGRPVASDLVIGLAMGRKLMLDIWGGRDDHGARTRFGKALSRMRDRIIGGFRISRAGEDTHAKVLTYTLERITKERITKAAGVAGVSGGFSDPKMSVEVDHDAHFATQNAAVSSTGENSDPVETPATPRNPRIDPWDSFIEEVGNEGVS